MKYELQGIELQLYLGVPEEERATQQQVLVGIQFTADSKKAAQTDNIDDAPNYQELYDTVQSFSGTIYQLLESLCGDIFAALTQLKLGIHDLKLQITKQPFPDAKVIVTIDKNSL